MAEKIKLLPTKFKLERNFHEPKSTLSPILHNYKDKLQILKSLIQSAFIPFGDSQDLVVTNNHSKEGLSEALSMVDSLRHLVGKKQPLSMLNTLEYTLKTIQQKSKDDYEQIMTRISGIMHSFASSPSKGRRKILVNKSVPKSISTSQKLKSPVSVSQRSNKVVGGKKTDKMVECLDNYSEFKQMIQDTDTNLQRGFRNFDSRLSELEKKLTCVGPVLLDKVDSYIKKKRTLSPTTKHVIRTPEFSNNNSDNTQGGNSEGKRKHILKAMRNDHKSLLSLFDAKLNGDLDDHDFYSKIYQVFKRIEQIVSDIPSNLSNTCGPFLNVALMALKTIESASEEAKIQLENNLYGEISVSGLCKDPNFELYAEGQIESIADTVVHVLNAQSFLIRSLYNETQYCKGVDENGSMGELERLVLKNKLRGFEVLGSLKGLGFYKEKIASEVKSYRELDEIDSASVFEDIERVSKQIEITQSSSHLKVAFVDLLHKLGALPYRNREELVDVLRNLNL